MMEDDNNLIGHFTNEICPKCGAHLLKNKRGDKWCSWIGDRYIAGCDYGTEGGQNDSE